jgi:MEMO1 family protein
VLSPRADEAEHSLELHMPYLMEVMKGHKFSLVSIMVGALTPDGEALYGEILAPYLEDPENFFIISSDFCHWGSRFNYVYYQNSHGDIHQSIEALDHEGMRIIESGDPVAFTKYLSKTGNTICGRHPIGVFLQAASRSDVNHNIKFTQYDQSHQCLTHRDSSVSYASAAVTIDGDEEDAGAAAAGGNGAVNGRS